MLNSPKSVWYSLAAALGILIIILSYIYLKFEVRRAYETKGRELESIARLKSDQIAGWFNDEINDAGAIADNRILVDRFVAWLDNPAQENIRRVEEIMQSIKVEHDFEHVLITGVDGNLLLSADGKDYSVAPDLKRAAVRAIRTGSVLTTDLYNCPVHDTVRIDFTAPLKGGDGQAIGAIVFQFDPSGFLYPLIRSWPTLSNSSETLLYRVLADSILFLNELKHNKKAALQYSIPITATDVVAVKALDTPGEGLVEGLDYAGNKVLGYVMHVPHTGWMMVSKTDKRELFGALRYRILLLSLLTVFLLLSLGAGMAFFYNVRQKFIFRELYKQQKNYQITLNSIGDAVISTDKKGRVEYLNPVAEQITGWTLREARGKRLDKVFRIINEETRNTVESPVDKVLREGVVVGLANHTLLISKDGRETPIADSGAPITSEQGEIMGVVLVFRDQTGERMFLDRIARSEERFRKSILQAPIPVMVYDEDGNIIDVSEGWTHFSGYDPGDIPKVETWCEKAFGGEAAEMVLYFNRLFSEEMPVLNNEFEILTKHGEKRVWNFHAAPLGQFRNGKRIILTMAPDTTQRKRLLIDLTEAKERAEESERLKMAFLANMSHEIRTPLNGILGFTNLIAGRDDLTREKKEEFAGIINQSASGLLKIINDILDISRLETSKAAIERKQFNVEETLSTIYSIFGKRLADSGSNQVELIVRMPDEPVVLNTDENRLIQIFSNLLDNAVRFTSEGSVTFGIGGIRENKAEFFVKDTGVGISEEKHEVIFDRFSQADNSATRSYGGTGLGLTIVKKLLELMGSDITLESEPGKGTCFRFQLPCILEETRKEKAAEKVRTSIDPGASRILVVEDDPVSCHIFSQTLSDTFAELLFAVTGQEGVDMFALHNPDIVLMDIGLPDISGLEVVRRIREMDKKVVIIAQTAYAMADDRIKAMEAGCNDFITKPINIKLLLQKLRNYSN
ncbi:MAG: ATP-binding protein [Bacteroidales bacterium]